nr:DoxX family membrane protein [Parabacteroides sp. AM58-2XD]
MIQKDSYTSAQLTAMVVLRLFIGWHFAYEGLVKILNPKWTSLPYLLDSKGFMSDFFAGLASDPAMMNMVNALNEWALLLIGLGLITGAFSKLSSIGAMILLAFYYLSHPSFIGHNI